jgi:hypothetical protein
MGKEEKGDTAWPNTMSFHWALRIMYNPVGA